MYGYVLSWHIGIGNYIGVNIYRDKDILCPPNCAVHIIHLALDL